MRFKPRESQPSRTEVWRLDTGEIEGQTQPLGIRAVLPKGRILAFPGKRGNSLGVWEPGAADEPRIDFLLPFEPVDQLAYHLTEEGVLQVLTRNRQDAFEVHRLDRHGGRQAVGLAPPADARLFNQADFSDDGRYVAMAFGGHLQFSLPNLGPPSNRFARVWDTRDGSLTHELPASDAVARALLAPDNNKLLVVQAQRLVLWDLAGKSCLWEFKGCNHPKSAGFRQDGKHIAVVGFGGPRGGPALFWFGGN
jgi:hypothetical protein